MWCFFFMFRLESMQFLAVFSPPCYHKMAVKEVTPSLALLFLKLAGSWLQRSGPSNKKNNTLTTRHVSFDVFYELRRVSSKIVAVFEKCRCGFICRWVGSGWSPSSSAVKAGQTERLRLRPRCCCCCRGRAEMGRGRGALTPTRDQEPETSHTLDTYWI